MPVYECTVTVEYIAEVEADDEDKAMDAAEEELARKLYYGETGDIDVDVNCEEVE